MPSSQGCYEDYKYLAKGSAYHQRSVNGTHYWFPCNLNADLYFGKAVFVEDCF